MSDWQPGKFQIKCPPASDGGRVRRFTKTGTVWGCWGVDLRGKLWFLTHRPTGYCVPKKFGSERRAQKVAELLDGYGDWAALTTLQKFMAAKELRENATALLSSYSEEHPK